MRRIALALTLAGLTAAVPACKKGDGGGVGGGGAPAGAAASALDVFPETTAGLFGISIPKIVESKLWKQFGAKALEDEEAKKNLQLLKDKCGADPMTDIQSVVIGFPDTGENDNVVVLIKGKFDQAKLEKCGTAIAESESKKVSFKHEGKITEITTEGEEKKAYLGWAGSDAIIIVPKAMEGDKAALEAVLNQKSSAKNNKELAPLLGNVNTGETMWVAVAMTGKLGENVAAGDGPKPKAAWGTIAHTKDLKIDAGIRFANDKDAKDFADKTQKELEGMKGGGGMPPSVGKVVGGVKLEAKGSDVLLTVNISEADLDALISELGPMLGMLMGGALGGM